MTSQKPCADNKSTNRRFGTARDAWQQNQDEAVEEKRYNQGRSVAEAQVFEDEFEGAEGDGGVRDPTEFDVLPARSQKCEDEGERAVHDRANHGEARRSQFKAA